MKRFILLMLSCLFLLPLMAVDYESIDITAIVPEDYGVIIPDAFVLDRLVFEIELASGEDELLLENEISLGELSIGKNTAGFSLLYYGNLSSDYDVLITAYTDGIYNDSRTGHIPVEIEIFRDNECLSAIETTSYSNNEIRLVVPPIGAIEGERVLNFVLSYDSPRDLPVGRYEGTVDIELRSNV